MGGSHGGSDGEKDGDAGGGGVDVSEGYSCVNEVGWIVCKEMGGGAGVGYDG